MSVEVIAGENALVPYCRRVGVFQRWGRPVAVPVGLVQHVAHTNKVAVVTPVVAVRFGVQVVAMSDIFGLVFAEPPESPLLPTWPLP